MKSNELIAKIANGGLDERFLSLYDEKDIPAERERYINAINNFTEIYGEGRELALYSVAGRSELAGNHTDHNHGCVVAASISLDIIAVASKNDEGVIRVKSEGFDEQVVDLSEYTLPKEELFGTSASIIAGMCAGFKKDGHKTGGFDAYMTSTVLKGSGLSSSAAFEDMIGNILSYEYNGGLVDNVEIAKLAQYSENVFFGKPCGLMDQMACAVGGIIAIDFEDNSNPRIEKMDFDLSKAGYNLCIVDTGGNHADLTADYASVPAEMKAVAKYFGKEYLRLCDEEKVVASISALRKDVGDRAVLRALHFFEENKRVAKMKNALKNNDIRSYFEGVIASGKSSFCYLQNVYTTKNVNEQGLSLALAVSERYLSGRDSAYRVHGGGFAGTIQAYVKEADVAGYRALMDSVFGEGACLVLRVRPFGATRVF